MSVSCSELVQVDAHFTGTIRPPEERAMREHLPGCETCRARYRRQELLASLDPESLSPERRIGRALGFSLEEVQEEQEEPDAERPATRPETSRPRFAKVVPLAVSALALAAALFLLLRSPGDPGADGGYQSRGSSASALPDPTPVATPLVVFRVRQGSEELLRASDVVARNDELAFAYDNVDRLPYLMIFGVDAQPRGDSKIYWFFPAWTDASERPVAVRAETGGGLHELGEAVRHPFAGDRIEIHALFLEAPIDVRTVETAVRKRVGNAGTVEIVGGVDHLVTLEIHP